MGHSGIPQSSSLRIWDFCGRWSVPALPDDPGIWQRQERIGNEPAFPSRRRRDRWRHIGHFLLPSYGGRSIRASAQGVRLATVKWLSNVPEEPFVEAALNLRKRVGEDANVRETFLMQRAKVIEQLRSLQADENLRGWAANQMAAVRSFYVLDISRGAATGDACVFRRCE